MGLSLPKRNLLTNSWPLLSLETLENVPGGGGVLEFPFSVQLKPKPS